jgi:hypothetical protein
MAQNSKTHTEFQNAFGTAPPAVLNLLQCYPFKFHGGKARQKERGRESPRFQLVRNAGLRLDFKAVLFSFWARSR